MKRALLFACPTISPRIKNGRAYKKKFRLPHFFNMLGPMVNPANPEYQLVGV